MMHHLSTFIRAGVGGGGREAREHQQHPYKNTLRLAIIFHWDWNFATVPNKFQHMLHTLSIC